MSPQLRHAVIANMSRYSLYEDICRYCPCRSGQRDSSFLQDTHRFLREITREHDPGRLFLGFLPAMFGADGGLDSVVEAVECIRNEVDSILVP